MGALAGQRVQIQRQGRDECLAFAGLHLGDLAAMQNDAADELDVVVTHAQRPPCRFADHGKRFRKQLVECLLQLPFVIEHGVQPLAELVRLCREGRIVQHLDIRFERVDGLDDRTQAPEFALVLGAKDLCQCIGDHRTGLLEAVGAFDHDRFQRHIAHAALHAGADVGDLVHDIQSLDDAAEHGVTDLVR